VFRRTLTALAVTAGVAVGATITTPAFAANRPDLGPHTASSTTASHQGATQARSVAEHRSSGSNHVVKTAWSTQHSTKHHKPGRPPHGGYPASVPTVTHVFATQARFGAPARVFVSVAAGVGKPTGSVTVTVAGQTQTAAVRRGGASATFTGLAVGTYPVTAAYTPTPGSKWKASTGSTTLVVQAARSRTTVFAGKVREPDPATLTAWVRARGATPAGTVTFTVAGSSYSAPLAYGKAAVSVPGLSAGVYVVTATFTSSNPSVQGSTAGTTLRVLPQRHTTGYPHGHWGSWFWAVGFRSGPSYWAVF